MMSKSIWSSIAVAVVGMVILVATPAVRSWLHEQMPFLGINGSSQEVSSSASSVEASIDESTLVTIDAPGMDTQATGLASNNLVATSETLDSSEVRLAQATLPINQQGGSAVVPLVGPPAPLGNFPQNPRIAQGAERGPLPVGGITVPAATSSSSFMVTGATLTFVRDRKVAAQADGIITKLPVDDGSLVNEGDLLVELDTRVADAEVRVQTRELDQAKLKSSDDSNVKYARAAHSVASIEKQISDKLVQEQAEDLLTNQKKGLELKKAELQIKVSEIDHEKDVAAVGVSEAKLDAANVQVALRKHTANFSGIVSEVEKEPYDYVRAGEVVLRVTDMQRIRVRGLAKISIPPHLLLNAEAKVTITAPGVNRQYKGVVGHVAPFTGGTNDEYPVWVEIANEKLADGQFLLRDGMSASIEIFPNRP